MLMMGKLRYDSCFSCISQLQILEFIISWHLFYDDTNFIKAGEHINKFKKHFSKI